MPDPGGGAEGDVHVTKKDGTTFDFDGELFKRSVIYRNDDIQILGRFFPVPGDPPASARTYFGGVDVLTNGPSQIYFDTFGVVHVFTNGNHWKVEIKADTLDAIGRPQCSSESPHPLRGVPHVNVVMLGCPPDAKNEFGIMIDGDRHDAKKSDYVVDDPE